MVDDAILLPSGGGEASKPRGVRVLNVDEQQKRKKNRIRVWEL